MEVFRTWIEESRVALAAWLTSPQFYVQLAAIVAAVSLAGLAASILRSKAAIPEAPDTGPWLAFRRFLHRAQDLFFPILAVLLLGVAVDVGMEMVGRTWLIRLAQSLAVVALLYSIITRFIHDWLVTGLLKWVGIPLATLYAFGWLDDLTTYLDGISIQVGNIHVTAYAIGRTFFFGIILFWLGRISSSTGKQVIRANPRLDVPTREVAAKLFEVGLFVVLAIILLQVMGVNLTALAVFGGAFGIGLGLGLQQIAANFISGIIILLDRSITINDYVELEDGRAGVIRELNMRYATLTTYDGKDIMVPNETFVTTAFTNWTHHDPRQRYNLEFSVAYRTDIPAMLTIVRDVVASHPQVLQPPDVPDYDAPDAEIHSFGDSGINIEVEFWIVGVDEGPNGVCADLRLMIWMALREHGIEMPFPQREVTILDRPEPVGGPGGPGGSDRPGGP